MITKPTIYTAEFVKAELDDLLNTVKTNKSLVVMGELFEDKPYSAQRFSDWQEKFKDDSGIMESIKKIKDIFENRVNVGGLTNKLNPTMCIFNLKNNYNWKDKQELEQSGNVSVTLAGHGHLKADEE